MAWRGRSAGPDAVTIRDFETDWTRQMAQLAEDLRRGTYRPLPPKRVQIPKASGGERAIAILAVPPYCISWRAVGAWPAAWRKRWSCVGAGRARKRCPAGARTQTPACRLS